MIDAIQMVEVGPRDGFQAIREFIPTGTKVDIVRRLHAAGLRRIEVGSFVSAQAIPQLEDTATVLRETADLADLDPQVLIPTRRRAEKALSSDARHLAFVLSVSEDHNQNNVRRDPSESAAEYAAIVADLPEKTAMRLNIATAFDCPFQGRIAPEKTLDLLDQLVDVMPNAEIALCDTTGRVTPDHVESLFRRAMTRFPQVRSWNFHAHDTYGLGVANVLAAVRAGVTSIDAAIAGLGGCPFAPGATGNVATEDVVWTANMMGLRTDIDIDKLVDVAVVVAQLPGAAIGGRVRTALHARACLGQAVAA
ncbi:hydroxymethylglutaryl-CoA lyase [Sphingobium mellinum]|uniref:hydroxymethylglutaryl-CoA lyase n=1 Tax=Sphingobium mellinum TaxID=1387166 RepID=UPI0030ED7412